jgi:hypothetical protein
MKEKLYIHTLQTKKIKRVCVYIVIIRIDATPMLESTSLVQGQLVSVECIVPSLVRQLVKHTDLSGSIVSP